ncbi:MAG: CAP domain-containing protein [Burkholderiaceae bacterium]
MLTHLAVAATLLVGNAGPTHAEPAAELTELINRYRAEAPPCEGRDGPPLTPLHSDAALAAVGFDPGSGPLQAALDRAGYLSARAQAIVIGGPGQAGAAMTLLRERYCRLLLDPGFTRIASDRDARGRWRVLLAQPLLAPDLAPWPQAGREVLTQVNAARAQARLCGQRRYPAARPLRWSAPLGQAAFGHSQDMARQDYFDHRGRDGSDVAERSARQGYVGRRIGENIAAGQGDPSAAVAGWVASPGHCANLMDPGYTEMGAAYAVDGASIGKIYWTQVLGTPR